MPCFSIGIDLGGTNLRIAAVDDNGTLISKTTLGTQVALGRDHVINEMTQATREMMDKYSGIGKLCGIGIGVPGIIDMETGFLRESPNLPGWDNYPVRAEIERRLGTTVILENDANAAALGEKWLGAARSFDSMAMLTLGTGVGGGLVFDGKIWHGMNGMAGEVGHMNVETEGHPCKCGSRGCLEQYASATAVMRLAREAIARGEAPELSHMALTNDKEFNSRAVYQLALQGDEPAQRIFEIVGRSIGLVVADLVNALNLPIFVIGGGVSSAWDAFAPTLLAEVRKRSFVYSVTTPEDVHGLSREQRGTIITRALLGSDAGLYGAARLPLVHAGVLR